MNLFSVLYVGFLGGFAGGLLAMSLVEKELNSRLQELVYQPIAPYIDDIELQ